MDNAIESLKYHGDGIKNDPDFFYKQFELDDDLNEKAKQFCQWKANGKWNSEMKKDRGEAKIKM